VLTPHPLELARLLLGDGPAEAAWVNHDRPALPGVRRRLYDAVVLLKGRAAVVATPEGALWVLPYADASLGIAGAATCSRAPSRLAWPSGGATDARACTLEAAHAHGLAALRTARRQRGATRGLLAGEIAETLSQALEAPGDDAILAAGQGRRAPG
jgi:NAD(P)H-hydrate repair Nnr-like enzyme with NAD(P)H-hydrate dehydratase domain